MLERGDMEAQAAQAEAAAAAKEASKVQATQSAADVAAVILDDDEEGVVVEGAASTDTSIKVSRCVSRFCCRASVRRPFSFCAVGCMGL